MFHPYEGNLNEGAKQHIFAVTKRWLAPNGDTTKGVDGYRLDVADFIPSGFWRDYRTYVKSIKRDAYLVGEIQWWMDKMMPSGVLCQWGGFRCGNVLSSLSSCSKFFLPCRYGH